MPRNKKTLPPLHPGEVLLEEFLQPMELSRSKLALALGVPGKQIGEVVRGNRSVSAELALRLAHYFKMSPQFWLGLQMDYDLAVATDNLAERLERKPRRLA